MTSWRWSWKILVVLPGFCRIAKCATLDSKSNVKQFRIFLGYALVGWPSFQSGLRLKGITTVDTRLWKTKHSRKRFQSFRQSYVLLTCRIQIHQSQPLLWPSDLLYVMLAGCDWGIWIRHVYNTYDWRKLWKRFRECFVFQSRVSPKTVVIGFDNLTLHRISPLTIYPSTSLAG